MDNSRIKTDTNLSDRLGAIADRFTEAIAEGGSPDIDAYVSENPELAEVLRPLLEALQAIESGGLAEIADDEMEAVSPRLASTSGGAVPAQADRESVVKPLSTSYQAGVPLDDSLGIFRNGLVGQGRIKTAPRTLASRLGRYLRRTFRFDL